MFCVAILSICGLVTRGVAAEKQWLGHNWTSHNWSDPSNWSPPGAPQDGDDVIFDFSEEEPSPQMQMHNDLVGLRVRKLFFCGYGHTSLGWLLDGNELTVIESVESKSGVLTDLCKGVFIFECPVKLDGPTLFRMPWGTLTFRGNINLNGNDLTMRCWDNLTISGQITGVGNIIADARASYTGSTITFDGPVGNTFSGFLSVRGGDKVVFDKESGVVVTDGLHIGNAPGSPSQFDSVVCKLARSHQIGDTAEVWVHGGSRFLLDGHTETIHRLFLTNYERDSEPSLVDTGGSTLSVLTDISVENNATNAAVVPTIRGKLGLPGPETAGANIAAASTNSQTTGDTTSKAPIVTTKSPNPGLTQ